ncbi:MAG: TonB-dependent receptor [Vicinamibacterales bacterium]
MISKRTLTVLGAAIVFLAIVPTTVMASGIAGTVKDGTGAILPGVTVEVASPALIERVRSAVTDDRGAYQIVDLRPGTYSVTFSLAGFNTVKRDAIELPSDFTATVDAEMRVGSLEETITVSGASPVVDVQSTVKAQVLTRELLDAIPTGRTAQSYGQLVTGVTMAAPDVGGARSMSQAGAQVHGMAGKETVVTLDGIQLNGMCGDGSTQAYSNAQAYEEMVFQTSGAGADFSAGGMRQNMVPRAGGNELHGSFAAYGSRHTWQASNITPELISRGLTKGDSLDGLYDLEGGVGGPLVKDRLWTFGAARRISANNAVADTFYPDGSQGVSDQHVWNISDRMTAQITKNNKITAYADRVSKFIGHDMVAGYDPVTASRVWEPSKLYMQGQAKWTSTMSSRLLLETGYSQYQAYRHTTYQPGIEQPYFTPGWYATATHQDTSLGKVWEAAPGGNYYLMPTRRFFSSALSYVTGSHNMKFGVQDTWGFLEQGTQLNADLFQIYQNGVPTQAALKNTPERDRFVMNGQWGVFAQDAWTLNRLTINAGLRWEYFKSSIDLESAGVGRFVGERSYGPETMPVWKTIAPRFGVTYDLLGNAKTALKFSANKYMLSATDGVAADYNPMRLQTQNVDWRDLNGDDIAQGERGCVYLTPGCELNFAQLPANFGVITPGCQVVYAPGSIPCGTDQVDPDVERPYNVQYSVGVQHELLPRVSLSANWFRTRFYNAYLKVNTLRSDADYTPASIANPIDGSAVTVYNVSTAKVSAVQNLNTTAPNNYTLDNSVEISFNARLAGGVTLFGGYAAERTVTNSCDSTNDPNTQIYCDQSLLDVPWLGSFKLAGSLPVKWGVQVGAAFQSYQYIYAGGSGVAEGSTTLGTVWNITRTTRYAADCKGNCTPGALVNPGMTVSSMNVPLVAPNTEPTDRIKQLDITVGRWFTINKLRVQPQLSLFNALNNRAVFGVRSMNYGTTSYLQPATVLQPRLFRLEAQVRW